MHSTTLFVTLIVHIVFLAKGVYSNCQDGYEMFGNVTSPGNIYAKANTLEGCRAKCRLPKCWGYTFFENGQCKLFRYDLKPAAALHFYKKVVSGDGSITYQEMHAYHKGGSGYEDHLTLENCEDMCNSYERCIGISFMDRSGNKGSRKSFCKIHIYPLCTVEGAITGFRC